MEVSFSRRVWEFLMENPGSTYPEVVASVGGEPLRVQRLLLKAVSRGNVSSQGLGRDRAFTMVRVPKEYAKTTDERDAKRREARARWEAKNPNYNTEWYRRKRGSKPRVKPAVAPDKPKAEAGPASTASLSNDVEAFLASGGRVEVLPVSWDEPAGSLSPSVGLVLGVAA